MHAADAPATSNPTSDDLIFNMLVKGRVSACDDFIL